MFIRGPGWTNQREGSTPPSRHWSWLTNVPCMELAADFNSECAPRPPMLTAGARRVRLG